MRFRTAVKLRRAIVFVLMFVGVAIGAIYNTFLAWIAVAAAFSLFWTDTCQKCGLPIFSMRGRDWKAQLNPFYVPTACSKCGNELGR
jgi:disulfide bond formation protein DsbB